MVLELGGFIELDNEIRTPSAARNPQNEKLAQDLEKNDVILIGLRPHKVLGVTRNDVPVLRVTVTAFDIWHNAIVQERIPDPNQNVDLVEIRHWRYLVRRINRIASGSSADGTEMKFKIPGDGGHVGESLGPFFALAEGQGAPIILKLVEALGKS